MGRTRNFEQVSGALDMESQLLAGLSKFKWYAGRFMRDDDFADRLSHTFTACVLVVFTLIISARQYIGKPIACWVPTEFTRAQEEYAESVCWVTSTYFIEPNVHNIPKTVSERDAGKLLYYQWVPFILMGQAFLFNIPCIVWRLFNWQSGFNLVSIMQVACDMDIIKDRECRRINVGYITNHIHQCLLARQQHLHKHSHYRSAGSTHHHRPYAPLSPQPTGAPAVTGTGATAVTRTDLDAIGSSYDPDLINANANSSFSSRFRDFLATKCCCLCCYCFLSKGYGSYLFCLYITCKFLYGLNIISQFFLMNLILGTDYTFFGVDLMLELMRGRMWHQSGHFPRITMCDFVIRKLANQHRYTVQCVLPINMFNEKIFIFLWFWFVMIASVTFFSTVTWLYKLTFSYNRITFITNFLKLRMRNHESLSKKRCYEFVEYYLRQDGVFLLQLLSQNAGDLIASEITDSLWKAYFQTNYGGGGGGGGSQFGGGGSASAAAATGAAFGTSSNFAIAPTAAASTAAPPYGSKENHRSQFILASRFQKPTDSSTLSLRKDTKIAPPTAPLPPPIISSTATTTIAGQSHQGHQAKASHQQKLPLSKDYSNRNPMEGDEDPGEFV